jgi:hypothetical protein
MYPGRGIRDLRSVIEKFGLDQYVTLSDCVQNMCFPIIMPPLLKHVSWTKSKTVIPNVETDLRAPSDPVQRTIPVFYARKERVALVRVRPFL